MTVPPLHFPPDFLWGTATSSHQVEGGQYNNDWWQAEINGGVVFQNQRSGPAADWWRRAEEDFDRMAAMGLNAHRLSIEWSRVQPHPDRWDEGAIDRYRAMIAALKTRGIQPMVTLHHFTNPLWTLAHGGWESAEMLPRFSAYVKRMVAELKEQVSVWCTINEPLVFASQSYLAGLWPPQKHDLGATINVALNMARAHAHAYHIIKAAQPQAQVGFAKHMVVWNPRRIWLPLDYAIARAINSVSNHAFLRILTIGRARIPGRGMLEMPEAKGTLDWLGINYYQRYRVGIKLRGFLRSLFPGMDADWLYQGTRRGHPKGPGGWGEFHAEGLFESLRDVMQYGVPLYITENGIPSEHDEPRVHFLIGHLQQVWRAIQAGFPVKGYYHWSLVDNFEWAEGYNPLFKFGLFDVNAETQRRTQKASAGVYAEIAKANAITGELLARLNGR
jgi:beta-glucosidase